MLYALELDPETGKFAPVSREDLRLETEGFTMPPDGMTRVQRRAWRSAYRGLRAKGLDQETAFHRACHLALKS